jgi:D-amino-acid dehydrogenase
MKTIIMGGGVVGMTMAYFLAKDGHEVTVIERNEGPARETSFQNAGLIATAHSNAWASPRSPGILMRSLFDKNAALVMKPRLDFQMMGWGLKFLKECTAERFRINTLRKLRICKYSEQFMPELEAETGIQFHHLTKGLLYCFRDQAHFDEVSKGPNLLADNGVEIKVVGPDEIIALDPAFKAYKGTVVGALYCPTDGSGDARVFTEEMAKLAEGLGVKMQYNTSIKSLRANAAEIEAVLTDKGEFTADNYVLSCGAYSPLVSKTVGVPLPIYPVKGYTVNFPCDESHATPEIGGVGGRPRRLGQVRQQLQGRGQSRFHRLRHQLQAVGLHRHPEHREGDLPERLRLVEAKLLGLRAADDAGRPADLRHGEIPELLAQHRTRPYRLDHGLRLRAHRRRYDAGQETGHRYRRFDPGRQALCGGLPGRLIRRRRRQSRLSRSAVNSLRVSSAAGRRSGTAAAMALSSALRAAISRDRALSFSQRAPIVADMPFRLWASRARLAWSDVSSARAMPFSRSLNSMMNISRMSGKASGSISARRVAITCPSRTTARLPGLTRAVPSPPNDQACASTPRG